MVQEGKTILDPSHGLKSCLFRDLNKPDRCLTIRCSWVLPSQDSIAQRLLEGPAFEPPKETNIKIVQQKRNTFSKSTFLKKDIRLQSGFIFQPAMLVYRSVLSSTKIMEFIQVAVSDSLPRFFTFPASVRKRKAKRQVGTRRLSAPLASRFF